MTWISFWMTPWRKAIVLLKIPVHPVPMIHPLKNHLHLPLKKNMPKTNGIWNSQHCLFKIRIWTNKNKRSSLAWNWKNVNTKSTWTEGQVVPCHHPTPKSRQAKFRPLFATFHPLCPQTPRRKPANLTQAQAGRTSYNQHWLVQEAEQRRISEQQMRHQQQQSPVYENSNYVGGGIQPQVPSVPPPSQYTNHQRPPPPPAPNAASNGLPKQQPSPPNENMYANLGQHPPLPPNYQREIPPGPPTSSTNMRGLPGPQVPPRNTHADGTSPKGGSSDRLLSVSGKKKCSHCGEELGRGAAMIIESLRLFYHLRCFRCVVCHVQLGNGSTGTDVRVRNNKLHCQNCYSNDEGLKFSKV